MPLMCAWNTKNCVFSQTYQHTEDLGVRSLSLLRRQDLYPFLPSWDSRKKPSSFFLLSSQCLSPPPASSIFFSFSDNPICSIYFTRWSKRLNCSALHPPYAFPCSYYLLLLTVIIISTKAIHKATHSLASLHILLSFFFFSPLCYY